MPITEGTRLDRYQILSPIGTGGMGEVYLAQDTRLGRKVAIKMLPAQYTKDPERLRRFEQEAFAASALNHPNIITIYEIGEASTEAGTVYFIVTEFIEGQTLRRRLIAGNIHVNEALDIAMQVASALAAAHSAGIIHRDLKPENLMIRPDGYVKMLDFGLAKLTEKAISGDLANVAFDSSDLQTPTIIDPKSGDTTSLARENDLFVTAQAPVAGETKPGIVMGTAQYMSPEQARGQRVDWRTDIFSFGIVLYEMLTARAPFTGASPKEIIAAILQTEPPPLARYLPGAPESLEWIVSKALVKDREERYQTAREMLNDFKRLQRRLTVEREMSRQTVSVNSGSNGSESGDTGGSGATTTEEQLTRLSGNSTREFQANTGVVSDAQSSGIFAHLSGNASRNRFFHPLFIALVATTLLAVGFSTYQFFTSGSGSSSPFQSMQVRRFTSSGRAARAAISPDGKYVVHVSSDAGRQSLLVRQVTPSDNVVIVPPSDVGYRGLTFSRDSTHVYYVVQERNDPILSLYQVPVLGGVSRKILRDIDSAVAISPDGKQLAFVRRVRGQGEDMLMLAGSDGSNLRTLVSRKGGDFFGLTGLDWSPDGKSIACPAGSNSGGRHMYVAEFNVSNGQERIASPQKWSNVGRVSWRRDGRGLIFTAIEQGSPLAQVWFLPYPRGAPQRITNDLIDYRDTSLTDDSTALVTVQSEAHVNVWLAPVAMGFLSDVSRARQITDGVGQRAGDRGLMWMPNGNLVFVSRASGSLDLWLMDQEGKNQQQLTTPETRAEVYPAVSPEGRYVVFSSNRTGNSNIYRLDITTGDQKQLTNGTSEEFPTVTPDGKFVIYTLTSSSKFTLWKVPIDGGEPMQLTDKLSQWPVVSPDGQRIACWYRQEPNAPWQIAIIPITGGQPEKLIDMPTTADWAIPIRWTPDGKGIGFVDIRNGVSNLWMQPLEDGEARQLTNFSADQILWFDWSRDGKQLACSRGRVTNDVVLISEFK
jgi:serine/threonine protein kinase/Tol biopolymer transport system component